VVAWLRAGRLEHAFEFRGDHDHESLALRITLLSSFGAVIIHYQKSFVLKRIDTGNCRG
jgi:hypothetical protein